MNTFACALYEYFHDANKDYYFNYYYANKQLNHSIKLLKSRENKTY